jgi:uncharacterized protein
MAHQDSFPAMAERKTRHEPIRRKGGNMKGQNGSQAIMKTAISAYAPAAEGERLVPIDILRGIALLGVLLINIDVFSGAYWAMEARLPYPMGWGGGLLFFLRQALIEGKAAALLSILFGAGMMMQMERAQSRGRAYWSFALRRMGVLALIGLAHSFLLWNGDILIDYAILGLMVLPFLKARPARLFWIIPVLIILTVLISLPFIQIIQKVEENPGWILQMEQQHFGFGTWLDALKFRSWEMIHILGPMRIQARLPMCVPFFILGIIFWKLGFLAKPGQHARQLRGWFIAGITLGLVANLLPQPWILAWTGGISFRPLRVLLRLPYFFGKPGLVIGYLSGLLLLLRHPLWQKRATVLAPLGRMALTQYLLQSLTCSIVFYGFGFGLFGKLPLNICIPGALAFFALQAWSSRLWLKYFYMGPAEWVWRSLAYGSRPRFRRSASS